MNLRENWRIVLLVVLVTISGLSLFVTGVGGETVGEEQTGGERYEAPIPQDQKPPLPETAAR